MKEEEEEEGEEWGVREGGRAEVELGGWRGRGGCEEEGWWCGVVLWWWERRMGGKGCAKGSRSNFEIERTWEKELV